MRSSPWLSWAVVMPLMALAFWAIWGLSQSEREGGAQEQASEGDFRVLAESSAALQAELSLKASAGLVSLTLQEPISGWRRGFSQAEDFLLENGEFSTALELPFDGEVDFFVDAKFASSAGNESSVQALALTLELLIEKELEPRTQTFWTESDEMGAANLSEVWALDLPKAPEAAED